MFNRSRMHNVQQLLDLKVREYLANHTAEFNVQDPSSISEEISVPEQDLEWSSIVTEPPKNAHQEAPVNIHSRLPRKFDQSQRDEKNKKLGAAGEEWVMKV